MQTASMISQGRGAGWASIEKLESRIAPALTATLTGAVANFVGDAGNDSIVFDAAGLNLKHNLFSAGIPGFETDFDFDSALAGEQLLPVAGATVTADLGAGDDAVVGAGAVIYNLSGGPGNDSLRGGTSGEILFGGDGNDLLVGGPGPDILLGEAGQDTLVGGTGNDTLLAGEDSDVFTWGPGDGSDVLEGQGGVDLLLFNGSAGAEIMAISANGGRMLLFRNVGNVTMDANDVEQVEVNLAGGTDTFTVNDLSGTDVRWVRIDMGSGSNVNAGDAAVDAIILQGSVANEEVRASSDGFRVRVLGLPALVELIRPEVGDTLSIDGGGGTDNVFATDRLRTQMTVNITAEASIDRASPSAASAVAAFEVGKGPASLVVGNLLGAGDDLVVVNRKTKNLSVLFNEGAGIFLPAIQLPTGGKGAHSAVIEDFNRDGLGDIAVTNALSGTISVLLNNGNGTFAPPAVISVGKKPGALRVENINNDLALDLVVATTGGLVRLLGDGAGGFATPLPVVTGGKNIADFAIADFNGDGRKDFAVAHAASNNVALLTQNPDESFAPPVLARVGAKPSGIAAGDFNGDGRMDVAVSHSVSRFVSVLLNSSSGSASFVSQAKFLHPGKRAMSGIAVADLDHDSMPDLILASSGNGSAAIFMGTGSGIFRAPIQVDFDNVPPRKTSSVATGDFNADGFVDFAVSHGGTNDVHVVYGLPN